MYSDQSWYKPIQHAAYVGQRPSSLNIKKSEHLYEETLGHELSHGISPVTFNGQAEVLDMNQNTKKINTMNIDLRKQLIYGEYVIYYIKKVFMIQEVKKI